MHSETTPACSPVLLKSGAAVPGDLSGTGLLGGPIRPHDSELSLSVGWGLWVLTTLQVIIRFAKETPSSTSPSTVMWNIRLCVPGVRIWENEVTLSKFSFHFQRYYPALEKVVQTLILQGNNMFSRPVFVDESCQKLLLCGQSCPYEHLGEFSKFGWE